MVRFGCWTLTLLLTGCIASPRVDVAGDISRTSGDPNAITIRTEPEAEADSNVAMTSLSRTQALRLALEHDPRIQAAIARVRVAEADAKQNRLLPNPILNLDLRFPEGGGPKIFEATLTGDLIAVLSMPGRIKAADQRLRAATADMLSIVLDVIAEVQDGYVSTQAAGAEASILESRAKILQQLRDLANNRLAAGEGIRLDVLTVDAQLLQLELELSDKREERTELRLALLRMIGQPRGEAEWELDSWQFPSTVSGSETAWIDAALANRPEIQSRTWELAALGEEVNLASLSPFQGGEIGAHGEHDQNWAIGPTLTTPLPIFDFGQASRAKAIALRSAAHHELALQGQQVIEEVRRAYAGYAAARSSLETAEKRLLPLQEQQRAQAEQAYRNGETDLTTLLLADSDLQDTHARIIQLQQKLTQAVIRLERAAGGANAFAGLENAAPTTEPATTQSAGTTGSVQ